MSDHSRGSNDAFPWKRWLCLAPLFGAAALICLINAMNLQRLVRAEAPRNPWEATEILESWRAIKGMPVYEMSSDGHSTHVYGALALYAQGEVFRWVGPNNIAGRLISLISALVTVTLLAVTMRGDRPKWTIVLSWAIILGVNFRSFHYFAENRPDMTALMFAAMGVLAIGHGQETRRWQLVVLGSAFIVTGFFFKQTAATFAVVPPIALILRGRRPTLSECLLAILPFAVMLGVIFSLKIFSPAVYYYMMVIPKKFGLRWLPAVRNGWELLLDTPLFLVLLGEMLMFDAASFRKDPRLPWLAAVLVVSIPFAAISSAKAGGVANSLLPALFPLMAFCALRLPRLLNFLNSNATAGLPSRLMLGVFVALLMMLTAFPRLSTRQPLLIARSNHDQAYWKVVDLVKRLPGKVICPEDPTIPFYAVGYLGLNIFSEYDTHLVNGVYPVTPPDHVRKELLEADYLIDVSDSTQNLLKDANLESLGFEPIMANEAWLESADYKVWKRTPISVGGLSPKPARTSGM
ncbi:hypothetical protein SAMN05444166_3997 [Singulisphaera sp. GP187]|uniref:ArnT family glycosyltransferase n=1 Tax=Singulisphaera sp. GP187 TaxID=1882752 RepID=UPI00092C5F6E|nr:hypothetical protein [Singulisphaera sp. GP187]SIO34987.1 hypothetical protein SAMN05444166_3997 [Singulisphaera sp. GP187]